MLNTLFKKNQLYQERERQANNIKINIDRSRGIQVENQGEFTPSQIAS